MTFKLKITLGNEAMQSHADVATALRQTADRLGWDSISPGAGSKILDGNGNTVGAWEVTK